jgi:hypothetical protein
MAARFTAYVGGARRTWERGKLLRRALTGKGAPKYCTFEIERLPFVISAVLSPFVVPLSKLRYLTGYLFIT